MELEEQEEKQGNRFELPFRPAPQQEHHQKDRGFHAYPGYFVGDGLSPFLVEQHAVAGLDEIKGDENNGRDGRHQYQQQVEIFVCHTYIA